MCPPPRRGGPRTVNVAEHWAALDRQERFQPSSKVAHGDLNACAVSEHFGVPPRSGCEPPSYDHHLGMAVRQVIALSAPDADEGVRVGRAPTHFRGDLARGQPASPQLLEALPEATRSAPPTQLRRTGFLCSAADRQTTAHRAHVWVLRSPTSSRTPLPRTAPRIHVCELVAAASTTLHPCSSRRFVHRHSFGL